MLPASSMPSLLQRKHVVRGYRPMYQPLKYYYKSAFCHHNEMMNVWTHLIPAFVTIILYVLPELMSETVRFPVLVLYFAVTCLLLGSSLAHLLHSRSPLDHVFWFCVDFAGIAIFGMGIGLQRYACNEDMNFMSTILYIPMLMIAVLGMQFLSSCFLFVCQPHWPYRLHMRMTTCLFVAVWLYAPLYNRYMNPTPEDDSITQHSRAFYWLLLSGVFMGAQVPERFAPGVFDIYGYGHQLFHLCINMVAWNLCVGAHNDCTAATASWSNPANAIVLATMVFSLIFIGCTIAYLMRKTRHVKYV